MATPAKGVSRITDIDLHRAIEIKALDLSRTRKAQALIRQYGPAHVDRFFDDIPSTPGEIQADWRQACLLYVDGFTVRAFEIQDVEPDCYRFLEGVWVDELKELLAYYKWLKGGIDWTTDVIRERQYFEACEELQNRLVNPACKAVASDSAVKQYLNNTYFRDGILGGEKTEGLIARKAARLSPGSRHCAKELVQTFYGNIIRAIDGAPDAARKVLKAIQHGGSSPTEPDIVSGFEALLAVLFLDPAIVKRSWEDHVEGISRQSTL